MSDPNASWEQAIRRKIASAPDYADVQKVVEARQQRKLLEWIIGKRVLDIAEVTDKNGDAVYLTFYGKVSSSPPADEEKCVAGVWLVEQRRQAVRYTEVVHRRGAFFLPDGTVLAVAVMQGAFAL